MNNQRKTILTLSMIAGVAMSVAQGQAAESLASRMAGRILLQVEGKGEAWYVNPGDQKRSYLGRPADALATMRRLGIGAANADLLRLPVGLTVTSGKDSDNDGLNDDLEEAVGTDIYKKDSDNDSYSDQVELENQFDPLSLGKINPSRTLTARVRGKILLQVENKGQAWYVSPANDKRYYLGSPITALAVMRQLGLGITNDNLESIAIDYSYPIGSTTPTTTPVSTTTPTSTNASIVDSVAEAIRSNDTAKTLSYFTPSMQPRISHTMSFLKSDGKLAFASLLSGAAKTSETSTRLTYSAETYFSLGNQKVTINFYLEKQADGRWLISKI